MAGKSSCKKLRELNINTIGELANSDYDMLIRNLKSQGKLLYEYANCIDESRVEPDMYEERKGIGLSRTLEYDSNDKELIFSYLYDFSKEISKKLRDKKVYANTIIITIRNNEFKTINHQGKCINAVNLTDDIFEKAKQLFLNIWDKEPIRLIGLRVTDFTSTNSIQLSIFDKNNDKHEKEQLQKIVDDINNKLGNSSVMLGVKK